MADETVEKYPVGEAPDRELARRTSIQRRIKAVLSASGMTMRDLAEKSGLALGTLHALLNDKSSTLSLLKILDVMHALGLDAVTVRELLAESEFASREPSRGADRRDRYFIPREEASAILAELSGPGFEIGADGLGLKDDNPSTKAGWDILGRSLDRDPSWSGDRRKVEALQYFREVMATPTLYREKFDATPLRKGNWATTALGLTSKFGQLIDTVGLKTEFLTDSVWTYKRVFDFASEERGQNRPNRLPGVMFLAVLDTAHPRVLHSYLEGDRYQLFGDVDQLNDRLKRVEVALLENKPWEAMTFLQAEQGVGAGLASTFLYFIGHRKQSITLKPVKMDSSLLRTLKWFGVIEPSKRLDANDFEEFLKVMKLFSLYLNADADLCGDLLARFRPDMD